MNRPLVSIISVTYNCCKDIEQTISSVLEKKKELSLEYIIVDGNSSDGTEKIIKSYAADIDFWVSEKDNGIYDAMNKGWSIANGKYILFVNAGDVLISIPSTSITEAVKEGIDLVGGKIIDSMGSIVSSTYDGRLKFRNTLPHQALFYRRELKQRFDTGYKVFADFDLNQRLFKSHCSFIGTDEVVCSHQLGGISHSSVFFFEVFEIIRKNFGRRYVLAAYIYHKVAGLKSKIRKIYYGCGA